MKSLSPEQSSWCGRAVKTPLLPLRGCVRLVQMDAPDSPLRQDNAVITPGCSCPLSLVYRLRYRTGVAQHTNPVELHDFFFITNALEFYTLQIATSRKSGHARRQEVGKKES